MPTEGLFRRMPGLVGEDALFGAFASTALLSAQLFALAPRGIRSCFLAGLELVEQQFPGEQSVSSLVSGRLAFDLESGRKVNQHDAGRSLVDVLTAVPRRADERLAQVGLANTQAGHPLGEPGVGIHGGGIHRGSLTDGRLSEQVGR